MRRVYEVVIEQPDGAGGLVPFAREKYTLEANTIERAISRAKKLFRDEDAGLKSKPIIVRSANLILKDLR